MDAFVAWLWAASFDISVILRQLRDRPKLTTLQRPCLIDRSVHLYWGVSGDGAGGARRGPSCWLARRSPRRRCKHQGANCERRDGQLDGPNAPGWVASENGPRRACAGRVVKRHFGHSPYLVLLVMRKIECPKCRFGGGAVCWSRPVPHLAALRGRNVPASMNWI